MKRAVLFDLDGTLVDSRDDIAGAFRHAAEALRPGTPLETDRIVALIGLPLAVMARELGLGLSAADERRFADIYRARFDAMDCATTRVFPGIVELLASLASRPVGVVTAKIQYQADHVVTRMGLRARTSHVQGWRDGLEPKPAPDLLHAALEAMGLRPDEAAYVGDTPGDVAAARAAGLVAIGVTWGFAPAEALRASRPERLVASVADLAETLATFTD